MGNLEVAGVIGTWVAAILVLIALFGVVGPILIWRASRTERHKAIVAIGLRNHGYVSRGIAVWSGVRLMQRVRAPRIDIARKFRDDEWRRFDSKRMKSSSNNGSESPASWVSFGAFLGGYTVRFETNSDVAVSNGTAFPPVSKAFLMTFALVGRSSDEPDRKRKVKRGGIRKWDARTSSHLTHFDTDTEPGLSVLLHGCRSDEQIHGLTGPLPFSRPYHDTYKLIAADAVKTSWLTVFEGEYILKPLEILPDTISLEKIRMLSLGFLPSDDDCFIYILNPLEYDDCRSINSDDSQDHQIQGKYKHSRSRQIDSFDTGGRARNRPGTPKRFKSFDPNQLPIKVVL